MAYPCCCFFCIPIEKISITGVANSTCSTCSTFNFSDEEMDEFIFSAPLPLEWCDYNIAELCYYSQEAADVPTPNCYFFDYIANLFIGKLTEPITVGDEEHKYIQFFILASSNAGDGDGDPNEIDNAIAVWVKTTAWPVVAPFTFDSTHLLAESRGVNCSYYSFNPTELNRCDFASAEVLVE